MLPAQAILCKNAKETRCMLSASFPVIAFTQITLQPLILLLIRDSLAYSTDPLSGGGE